MSTLFVNNIKPNSGDTVTVSGSLTTTGKLTIGDATSDTVSFVSEISSSLIPDVGATYDLGTMANSWRNLHAHGLGHIHTASINLVSSSLIPDADDKYSLGSSVKQWKDLYIDGTANVDAISIEKTTAASQDLNTSAEYSVNGSKVEVRAITAAQINDGAFASFKLLNSSIASDSVVLGSFTGGTAGVITGSILTAATTAARTASIQIHNETGGAIAADTPFTASFVVL